MSTPGGPPPTPYPPSGGGQQPRPYGPAPNAGYGGHGGHGAGGGPPGPGGGYGPLMPPSPGGPGGGGARGGTSGWLCGLGGVVLASAAQGGALFATGVTGASDDPVLDYAFAED
ncbi:hypothetical protein [Streptomyces sp. NBC_01803]|uniref:hypothetical protein n=1 Tax=Streptomyces sp. NBC_01803 TaxID=2975946 RepID=UPI002DD8335B|nr:hypothetical protein [Streptomyces sp. NBC_01803]WSA46258.1 hypothetical protein OIE51_19950 [Streptomyces sp. NBC_01803]